MPPLIDAGAVERLQRSGQTLRNWCPRTACARWFCTDQGPRCFRTVPLRGNRLALEQTRADNWPQSRVRAQKHAFYRASAVENERAVMVPQALAPQRRKAGKTACKACALTAERQRNPCPLAPHNPKIGGGEAHEVITIFH